MAGLTMFVDFSLALALSSLTFPFKFQNIYPLPTALVSSLSAGTAAAAYLDVVPTPEGYNHLALFSPPSSSTPVWLTSGEWEVTQGVMGVDITNGIVFVPRFRDPSPQFNPVSRYFEAANPLSTSRHLYSVALPSLNLASQGKTTISPPTLLTDASEPAYYATDFSPQAGFYLLSYRGPNIPTQKVVKAADSGAFHC